MIDKYELLPMLEQLSDAADERAQEGQKKASALTEEAEALPDDEQIELMDKAQAEWKRTEAYERIGGLVTELLYELDIVQKYEEKDD